MEYFVLNRDMSTFLKGIAIILMVIHHFFGFPNWYISSISYPNLVDFADSIAKFMGFLVVPMFAFLTGWSYFYHKDKSYKYSIKKICYFLISYWVVYILLLFIALSVGNYQFSLIEMIQSLFGINGNIMFFAWYVNFYILIMLFLPIYHRFIKKYNFFIDIAIIMLISVAIKLILKITLYNIVLANFSTYLPAVIMGYLCARYDFLNLIYNYMLSKFKNKSKIISLIIIICLGIIYSLKPIILINLGTFYIPIFLVCALIINIYKYKKLNKIICFLAVHSMNIWFIQCAFFSPSIKNIFQPTAFFPYNPILVIIWVLIICSIISIILNLIQKRATNILKCFFE
ncbi:acyltransferase family protein [Megamonas hypermegale]|uniref:acyltransferase family protein n=1 Tax=Megamonas hypermegale TaxID=158847 RepID=UPI0026EFD01C|nr:acyltransferase family protein [Megamonas hypermegale]